jgi:hypothetical protein
MVLKTLKVGITKAFLAAASFPKPGSKALSKKRWTSPSTPAFKASSQFLSDAAWITAILPFLWAASMSAATISLLSVGLDRP